MGAGTYYTINENGKKAFWIDFDSEDYNEYDLFKDNLINYITENTSFDYENDMRFSNGLYVLNLEPKYYGDGFVFQMNPWPDEEIHTYNLALGSFDKNYLALAKIMSKVFELRIATSGYTSTTYLKNQ